MTDEEIAAIVAERDALRALVDCATEFWVSDDVGIVLGPSFGDEESWEIIGENEQNGTVFKSLTEAMIEARELAKGDT